jgi:pimeloyl-ACP methyl ester carboxylesterase
MAHRKPTIVLVHGAFADVGGFTTIIKRLVDGGYPVVVAANPLRGLSSDAEQVRALLKSIEGPILLVGHSYGGAVISAAATGIPEVKALVYLAAFVPETGESVQELVEKFPGGTVGESPKGRAAARWTGRSLHRPAGVPSPFRGGSARRGSRALRDHAAPGHRRRPRRAGRRTAGVAHDPRLQPDQRRRSDHPPAAQAFMAERSGARVQVVEGASHLGVRLTSGPDRGLYQHGGE